MEQAGVIDGRWLTGRRVIDADLCVIGSGAGGGALAREAAEAGMKVVILERGGWWNAAEFTARPRDMATPLYRGGGVTVTLGRPSLLLPTGNTVGGTTTVNLGTSFRTPQAVLARWGEDDGLEAFGADALAPFFTRVERTIGVGPVSPALAGRNADLLRLGAERLGWSAGYLSRGAIGCVGSGVCAYGCPSGAKQHAGVAYVSKALDAGARLFTGACADRLELNRRSVSAVRAHTIAGGELRVRARRVVVAAGAIETPGLLHRFGVRSPVLGRHLSLHPVTVVRADFPEEVRLWDGVPQSFHVDQFAARGVRLMGISGPPDHLASCTTGFGAEHRDQMLGAARASTCGVMISDSSRGRVIPIGRRQIVRYDVGAEDAARFKFALERTVELYWAAGARSVMVPVRGVPTLRDGAVEPLRRHPVPATSLTKPLAFHPLGTARASADPARSVVDPGLAVRGFEGLYVADGSVVPSALGVNPQVTIMALATWLAVRLAGRALPSESTSTTGVAE